MNAPGFVAVSNRLPVKLERRDDGSLHALPGGGGLVTALAPVLSNRGGRWVGWPGIEESDDVGPVLETASRVAGYALCPVYLSQKDSESYYNGFSNGILWPLFHDQASRCDFDPRTWDAYQHANQKFAAAVAGWCDSGQHVWVHDYHLMHFAVELRRLGVKTSLGFFLHIPFPPLDIFLRLPWRAEVLRALLAFDLIGFQTLRDKRNFLYCVRHLLPECRPRGNAWASTVEHEGREVRVGSFPISIDYHDFERRAKSESVQTIAGQLRAQLGDGTVVLGVDRLDYTKGIPEKLDAFREMLLQHPELIGKITLVQIAVPSRLDVPEYRELRARIEQHVGEINGQFTRRGWAPVQYLFRSLDRDELIAHYVAADIALLTPLKDGMNLVAKEYCAASTNDEGVLILSEFAGAAAQMHRWALTVNPHDIRGVAAAIYRAYEMDGGEKRYRMRHMRRSVKNNDIYRWVDDYLSAASGSSLRDFPYQEEHMPPYDQL